MRTFTAFQCSNVDIRYSNVENHLGTARKTITSMYTGPLFRITSIGKKITIEAIDMDFKMAVMPGGLNRSIIWGIRSLSSVLAELRRTELYTNQSNVQNSSVLRQGQPKCLIQLAKLHSSTTLD